MTDPQDLARIDSVIDNAHCVAADSLTIGRATVKALVADAKALRELVALLPKCESYDDGHACGRLATREETGGMGDDFNRLYWCDEHGESSERGGDVFDVDWADVVRRLK